MVTVTPHGGQDARVDRLVVYISVLWGPAWTIYNKVLSPNKGKEEVGWEQKLVDGGCFPLGSLSSQTYLCVCRLGLALPQDCVQERPGQELQEKERRQDLASYCRD